MNRISRARVAVALALCLSVFCTACVSAAPKVYHDHIEPHWFAGGSRFWYRSDGRGDSRQFILVDAEHGSRQPVFDHSKVAAQLSKLLNRPISPGFLPIDSLDFETHPGLILLLNDRHAWQLDPGSGDIRQPPEMIALAPISGEKPSVASVLETSITFDNETSGPVEIDWITPEGKHETYAKVDPKEHHLQPTYAGHVWLVTDPAGRALAVYEANREPGRAVIDSKLMVPATQPATQPVAKAKHRRRRGPTTQGVQSPDGKWSATIIDHNLSIRAIEDDKDLRLSKDGRPGDEYSQDDLYWSPDSQYLLAMRIEAGQEHKVYTVESSPPDQVQPKLRTLNYRKPGDKVEHPRPQLFRIASHDRLPIKDDLFPNPWDISDVRWAADSSRVSFVYNQRGHQVLRLISVDAKTGQARAIVDETSKTFIDYSGKYFLHWVGDDELIWMSERDGWNHLWLYDAETGQVKNRITTGDWVVSEVVHVDDQKRTIWFKALGIRPGQDPYYAHFCRINFDGSGLVVLTEGDGDHSVQWSPGDAYFVDTWSRVDLPPVSELRRADTGQLVCKLEEADASEVLAARGGRWPERFAAKGRDGATDIYGIILYPRDFDPKRKYPVVEEIYAGPQDFYTPKAFHARYGSAQRVADRGMIVVQCDGMGTSGRSKAFHDVCWKNLRDAGFPDRIAWIKSAATTHPQMDLTRLGIYGGSAGGQNALAAMLWHNDFYKVAVADCGCHDNRMDKIWWNEQWMGWPVDKSYEESSNVVNAHLLKGKLMLIVGEMDDNVDPSSTMQVVNALEKANKNFELVVVTGAHHGAAETPYGSRRRMEFLTSNLLGAGVN